MTMRSAKYLNIINGVVMFSCKPPRFTTAGAPDVATYTVFTHA